MDYKSDTLTVLCSSLMIRFRDLPCSTTWHCKTNQFACVTHAHSITAQLSLTDKLYNDKCTYVMELIMLGNLVTLLRFPVLTQKIVLPDLWVLLVPLRQVQEDVLQQWPLTSDLYWHALYVACGCSPAGCCCGMWGCWRHRCCCCQRLHFHLVYLAMFCERQCMLVNLTILVSHEVFTHCQPHQLWKECHCWIVSITFILWTVYPNKIHFQNFVINGESGQPIIPWWNSSCTKQKSQTVQNVYHSQPQIQQSEKTVRNHW